MSIFEVTLEGFIDMNHERVLLSRGVDREAVESEFVEYCCEDNISPGGPICTMVWMILLKSYTFMRHWMNKHALSSFVSWLKTLAGRLENVLFENENNVPAYARLSRRSRRRGLAGLTT